MDTFVIPDERAGLELDEFLCLQYPGLSKGFLRQEIGAGRILVDGVSAVAGKKLRASQVVMSSIDWERAPQRPVSPGIEVPVLYESDALLVVDKPAGLAVEPERWMRELGSLAGALLQLAEDRTEEEEGDLEGGLSFRPRLVHRIDKDTTGAVLVAKNIEAERLLREAFSSGTIKKTYLALVEGEPYLDDDEELIIDQPIGPVLKKSGRMRIAPDGKASQTRFKIAERFDGFTLLSCEPITGRTHQIRVHMAHEGFPLVVDGFYGRRDEFNLSEFKAGYRPKRGRPEKPLIERLTLHAHEILLAPELSAALGLPEGEALHVTAPIPKDLERLLKQLRKVRPPR
ncbi:MAG: RluA family pseudouridine synthase [Planctomycetota bacterium]|jgi:RluA family pseudouridine synthase